MNQLTALATGILIHCCEDGDHLRGRIVLDNDRLIQFTARRGRVNCEAPGRRVLQALGPL